jgi:hypothetical protein
MAYDGLTGSGGCQETAVHPVTVHELKRIVVVPKGVVPKGVWPLFVIFILLQNSSPRKRRAASPVRPFHSKTKSARAGTRAFEP